VVDVVMREWGVDAEVVAAVVKGAMMVVVAENE
jgi:hypothetical protein